MSISNLYIDQGSDFSTTITINDSDGSALDLTNYTVLAQLRKTYSSSTFGLFTSTFDADRTTGKIKLTLTNIQTSSLNSGLYVYDVLISDVNSVKTRVVEGSVNISPMVTQ
jgi:hypothetical protein